MSSSETFEDELDAVIAESMNDPRFAAAFRESEERAERSAYVLCPFGRCELAIDTRDGRIYGGCGPVLCGCANLPGWKSTRYEGLPKPGWPGKARGRHGSRVQRSRHRRRQWRRDVAWFKSLDAS